MKRIFIKKEWKCSDCELCMFDNKTHQFVCAGSDYGKSIKKIKIICDDFEPDIMIFQKLYPKNFYVVNWGISKEGIYFNGVEKNDLVI